MALHEISIDAPLLGVLARMDVWSVTPTSLNTLAQAVLGHNVDGWVRPPGSRALIAERKLGTAAEKLSAEIAWLNEQTAKVRVGTQPAAALRAAAFFHLRFENIHPLRDGNGRVGRLLLAAQCAQTSSRPVGSIMADLYEWAEDYRMVFSAPQAALQYEVMVDLLARIVAISMEAGPLPFSLEPVFRDRQKFVPSIVQQRATPWH